MTRLRAARSAPLGRVVAVPHAGGGPRALLPVLSRLPPSIEVVGVTLPGREERIDEPFHATAADPLAVIEAVLAEIDALPAQPTVLFGHSMGAALAVGMAVARPRAFRGLVLSAPPVAGTLARRAGRWTDKELLDVLQRGGHTPAEVLASPAWRRYLLDRMRVDLTLAVRLAHISDASRLAPPVTLLQGDRDDVAPPPDPVAWRARAVGGLRMLTLPGGHFFVLDEGNADVMTAVLVDPLPPDRAAAAGAP